LNILDAYKIVLLHSESISSILNRKTVSKEMLLKYLTDNNIPVTNNFTKATLVDQVLEYWRNLETGTRFHHQQQQQIYHPLPVESNEHKTEHFPINIMSRSFCGWFYKNFNDCTIQPSDFWQDGSCLVRMIDNAGDVKEDSTITPRLILNLLYSIKSRFNFYFNPNLSHEGTRGK
jgi:Domain of unknown function (DUF4518)